MLVFLALLLVPTNVLKAGIVLLALSFFWWLLSTLYSLSQEKKRLFLKTAFLAPKMQKLCLGVMSVWLIKVFLEALAFLDIFNLFQFQAPDQFVINLPLSVSICLFACSYMAAAAVSTLVHKFVSVRAAKKSVTADRVEPACGTVLSLEAVKASRLPAQAGQGNNRQLWTDISLASFNLAYLVSLVLFSFGEVGGWMTNWLIASARDAGLPEIDNCTRLVTNLFSSTTTVQPPESLVFELLVKTIFAFILYVFTSSVANRLSVLLVAATKRALIRSSLSGDSPDCVKPGLRRSLTAQSLALVEAPAVGITEALRMKRSIIKLNETNTWFKHTSATFWWLTGCYLTLFFVFGLMGGSLGTTICRWFDACLAGAHFNVADVQTLPPLRWFCAAIVSLYGTVPLAITGSVYLPFLKRQELIISEDGMSLPDGPRLSLDALTFRTWEDFQSVDFVSSRQTELSRRSIAIKFHSGGSLRLKLAQLCRADLHNLLWAIDENAPCCVFSDDILALKDVLSLDDLKAADAHELRNRSSENYMSTIFVPLQPGEYLKGKKVRIVRLLASKPLSAVYLARDSQGKFLVVKQFFLADETKETQALKKIFARECELLKKLNHPAIARVVDHFQDGSSSFLLLEHERGEDLRTYISENGKMSQKAVLWLAEQLAEIMKYLHEQDPPVIHRDLTPDNIVIDENGKLALIDFGAAHQFLEGITGTMIGKQCYTAPEQLRGNAVPQSDIYSFGCTLYFLLTGEEPTALSRCSVRDKVSVCPSLDYLLAACTEFEASERFSSFAQILAEIKHCRSNPFWQGDRTAELDKQYDCLPVEGSNSAERVCLKAIHEAGSGAGRQDARLYILSADGAAQESTCDSTQTGLVISLGKEVGELL